MTDAFLARAADSATASVVVRRSGEPLIEWHDEHGDRRVELMSVTKMVVAIGAGTVLDVGMLDTPLTAWFPELTGSTKESITARQIFTHTSGFSTIATQEIYAAPDCVELALGAELTSSPGAQFMYSNLAINLIGGLVARIAGASLHEVVGERVFASLGISDWIWRTDDAGNPYCMSDLEMHAGDLARLGEVLLRDGAGVVPADWVASIADGIGTFAQHPVRSVSFPPELLATWRAVGVAPEIVERVGTLQGRLLTGDEWQAALFDALGEVWIHRFSPEIDGRGLRKAVFEIGEHCGFGHDGDGGQQLIVLPEHDAVVARLRDNFDVGGAWGDLALDAVAVLNS